jgi:hypothetical protein
MRRLLNERLDRWETAPFKDKSGLTWEVVDEIINGGGRFLKEDPNGWFVEVEAEVARQKVSIAFRDMVKRKRERRTNEVKVEHQVKAGQDLAAATTAAGTVKPLNSATYEFLSLSNSVPPKRRKLATGEVDTDMNCFCWGI